MSSVIDLSFRVPRTIEDGLRSGVLERIGGVIRRSDTKEVVHWLKEAGDAGSGAQLIVRGSQLSKALLAASDFMYMHEQFQRIAANLERIEKKIDAQMLGKAQGAIQMAADAEMIRDFSTRQSQLRLARSSLIESTRTYAGLSEEFATRDGHDSYPSFDPLRISVLTEIAVARSYFLEEEYDLAALHLHALSARLSTASLHYCKVHFDDGLAWWEWLYMAPLIPIGLAIELYERVRGIEQQDDTESREEILRLIARQEKKQAKADAAIAKVLERIEENELQLPDTVNEMVAIQDFIAGYLIEVDRRRPTRLLT